MYCGEWVGLPGVHALHQDLVLFTLHHVVGEHGVEVRDGGGQDDAVSAELVIPNLQTGKAKSEECTGTWYWYLLSDTGYQIPVT